MEDIRGEECKYIKNAFPTQEYFEWLWKWQALDND
jgi:hypothetical protein